MKTLKIFSHKGHLAAMSDQTGTFVNDVTAPGQMGVVVATNDIVITNAAKKLISDAGRQNGSFSDVMLTNHGDGTGSVGFLGFGVHYVGQEIKIGRDCDKDILDLIDVDDTIVPQDFIDHIENAPSEEE